MVVNRVIPIIPAGTDKGAPIALHVNQMPEQVLGVLQMLVTSTIALNQNSGPGDLTGTLKALTLDPAGTAPAGLAMYASLLSALTELRALGEELLAELKEIRSHQEVQTYGG